MSTFTSLKHAFILCLGVSIAAAGCIWAKISEISDVVFTPTTARNGWLDSVVTYGPLVIGLTLTAACAILWLVSELDARAR